MNKENFRYYIKVRTALNIPASDIYDELYSVHGDQAPSYRTVRRWAQWFREGRKKLKMKHVLADLLLKQHQKILTRSAFLLMMILILQYKRCKRKLA